MCYDYTVKSAPQRAKFREPRSTELYPNPCYNEARYKEGRLYLIQFFKLKAIMLTLLYLCLSVLAETPKNVGLVYLVSKPGK